MVASWREEREGMGKGVGRGGWGEGLTLTTVPECPSKRATTDWLLISHTTILLSCEVCNE